MNNTAEMTFLDFPKVKWLQYTGKMGKCTSYRCQIFSWFNTPKIEKSLKSVNFWQIYWKNKRGPFFVDTVYNYGLPLPPPRSLHQSGIRRLSVPPALNRAGLTIRRSLYRCKAGALFSYALSAFSLGVHSPPQKKVDDLFSRRYASECVKTAW